MAGYPRWGVLFLLVPLLCLFREIKWTPAHTWGTLFLVWCALSLFWAVSVYDGIAQLWKFVILGLCFLLGASERDFRPVLYAFALGMAISSILAVFQYFGFRELPQAAPPAGLFMNRNYLAEAAVMAMAGVVAYKRRGRWLWVFLLSPAVILPGSMGAYATIGLLVCSALPRRWAFLALTLGAVAVGVNLSLNGAEQTSLDNRIALWLNSLSATTLFGHGVGGFWAFYPYIHDALIDTPLYAYSFSIRPRTAHNDALTLLVSVGLVGLFLLAMFLKNVLGRREPAAYVLVAFLLLGLFNFPLYSPATAFLAAVAAGHLCRDRRGLRVGDVAFRKPLRPRAGF